MGRKFFKKNIKIEVQKAEKINDIVVLEARKSGGIFETMGC